MYPYLWLRVRKSVKGVWIRYFVPKRERTASLHEFLEPIPDHGEELWRHWFLLLPLLPLLYYLIFVRDRTEQYLSLSRSSLRPPIHKTEFALTPYTIQIDYPKEKETAPVDTQLLKNTGYPTNNTDMTTKKTTVFKKKNISAGNRFWKDMSVKISKWGTDIPWCKSEVKSKESEIQLTRNISIDETYRDQVQKGGYHEPSECRSRHKVAIIVPFRSRQLNLAVFLYNMHPFLIDQQLQYRIFVIEQDGTELFNKGRLLNVGFIEAQKYGTWDCMVFHDVDLLPMNKQIMYTCPTWPRHMCAAVLEDPTATNSHTFFGGVSSMTLKQFINVNGYSNLYWGWGGEDSDMFWRLRAVGFPIVRYNKDIAKYLSLPHKKHGERPNRNDLLKTSMDRYTVDGLTSIRNKYKIVSVKLTHLCTHILVDVIPKKENN